MNWINILKKTALLFSSVLLILYVYDYILINNISPKQNSKHLRIGYINLHASQIGDKDLQRLREYNCDLWLFLEWNGDNLVQDPGFSASYPAKYEYAHPKTYGMVVFAKSDSIDVVEIDKDSRPYTFDYAKHLIRYRDLEIYLLHAPPPIPGSMSETSKYINDFNMFLRTTSEGPKMIIGDMNSTGWSPAIQKLKASGFANSDLSSWPQGTFAPTTWLPKMIRFDHIFHNAFLRPQFSGRFSISNSDHSGWIVDYSVPSENTSNKR